VRHEEEVKSVDRRDEETEKLRARGREQGAGSWGQRAGSEERRGVRNEA